MRRIKIGIDVGGTFTHAVAIDAETLELAGKAMVPTTHNAPEGVARGVVQSLHALIVEAHIQPEEVAIIAHSTTQATNALLEGDVAPVGVIGIGSGVEGRLAKRQTDLGEIELAPGKFLSTYHRFIDSNKPIDGEEITRFVKELILEGAQVFVVSEAFGVDDRSREQRVAEIVKGCGYQATCASEISQLYGLRVRTRTAVLNASMLPKMLETADMTERSIRESGIKAPLMIMRSDGGIMDVNEMRKRPILTMLSGPAAGVAAALMYVKISDGIFIEVGGTSTDISIIKNGRPMVRTAEVGGNRLYLRTLDVRTIGIAGGSMARVHGTKIHDVGPRSAHIAGLKYISFAEPNEFEEPSMRFIQPKKGDPGDYMAIAVKGSDRPQFTLTPTEASNLLGLVKSYAVANAETMNKFRHWVADYFKTTAERIAEDILNIAAAKVQTVVEQIILEYKLDKRLLALVGGGGGAEAIVPYAANMMQMEHWIARNAEVVSAIGAALGMIRDTIERSVVHPTESDILRIRTEAMESVLNMGACPDSVEVKVEVDTKQKRVIATATGTPEMRKRDLTASKLEEDNLRAIAAKSAATTREKIHLAGETKFYNVYRGEIVESKLFGLFRTSVYPTRVLDKEGVVRLKLSDCSLKTGTVSTISSTLGQLIDDLTIFGDAGGLNPDVFVIVSGRIVDLSGLVSKDQVLSLLRAETERFHPEEAAIALVSKK